METPSSTRRVTRSQAKASMNTIIMSESETVHSRQRNAKLERSALIDITNDSPITGLAMGFLETPSSQAKKGDQLKKTPGSGETLLRGQVKTLLQKVEEEAELVKLSFDHRSLIHLQDILKSPSGLLAPTPANTPNVPNLSYSNDVINVNVNVTPSEVEQEIHQEVVAIEDSKKETLESEKSLITRSLFFDFTEKSEISDSSSSPCSSVLTSQGKTMHPFGLFDEEEEEEEEEEDYGEAEDEEGGLLDELCEGLSKISVEEKKIPEFAGKHTRFVYNSDDEIEREEEEEVKDKQFAVSPSILRLKGMPTPEGKHLRFPEEEEED